MPTRLNIGASRKIADNNYGSRGASVGLDVEVDSALLNDPGRLKEQIRQLFGLVRSSLAEELKNGGGEQATPNGRDPGKATSNANGNGNESNRQAPVRRATQSQIKALFAITRNRKLDLNALLQERLGIGRADDLSIRQASDLIDELKGTVNGKGGGR